MYSCPNPNYPTNHGKWWSNRERRTVRDMRHQGYTFKAIAKRLGRSKESVKAMHEKLCGSY